MDYETALSLKKAGFPYTTSGYFIESSGMQVTGAQTADRLDRGYVPTLEELIEATPSISTLRRTGMEGDRAWAADAVDYPDVYGATPTEAVAKLWLALNTK